MNKLDQEKPDTDKLTQMGITSCHADAPLYRAEQTRQLDALAMHEAGIAGTTLMLRAGRAAFDLLQALYPDAKAVTVLCGGGNNAGDGYVVANCAAAAGWAVKVVALVPPRALSGDAARAATVWQQNSGETTGWSDADRLHTSDVIVDAILGTGADRALAGEWLAAVAWANASAIPVLALDIPSGLHASTGSVIGPTAINAAHTITFIGRNVGLFTGQAATHVGQLWYANCGVPETVFSKISSFAKTVAPTTLWQPRQRTAHKGSHGFVLAIGGDESMPGAIRLCAEAAARGGAGRVAVASHPQNMTAVVATRPELMFRAVVDTPNWDAIMADISVLVCGPGLGRSAWSEACWQAVVLQNMPKVLDADALYWLANTQHVSLGNNVVLTPHPGEAAMLLDCTVADVENDRFAAARNIQQQYGGVVVLKGAGTIISDGESIRVNTSGNAALATGGTGDVLAGLIVALLAQGLSGADAACLAVWVHGKAAERLRPNGGVGLLANDLPALFGDVLAFLEGNDGIREVCK